jgi:hypothetical protein
LRQNLININPAKEQASRAELLRTSREASGAAATDG